MWEERCIPRPMHTLLEYIDHYIDGVKKTMDAIVSIIDASERDRASL